MDLAKSNVLILDRTSETHAALYDTMPTHPVPPSTVADVAKISSNRSLDILAVIKSISEKRMTKSGEQIVDVELVDNSLSSDGKIATIMVTVFGTSKVN